jgi:arginase
MAWIGLTAPFDCSGASRGEELAPEALARAGLFEELGVGDVRELDARLDDDVRDPSSGIIGYERVVEISRGIHTATSAVFEEGARPVLVGGDCGCIIGALAAARDHCGRLGVCFLDAHLDSWNGATSTTGELADMDIAIITGQGDAALVDLGHPGPICRPGDAIVIGYRVATASELQGADPEHLLADPRMQVIRAESVLRHDAATVGVYAAERLAEQAGSYWLHFDVDCFDARVMPAMSYAQDFGLAYEHVEALLRSLLSSAGLVGFSITDFTPPKDPDGLHAGRIVGAVARAWRAAGLG